MSARIVMRRHQTILSRMDIVHQTMIELAGEDFVDVECNYEHRAFDYITIDKTAFGGVNDLSVGDGVLSFSSADEWKIRQTFGIGDIRKHFEQQYSLLIARKTLEDLGFGVINSCKTKDGTISLTLARY